MPLDPPPIARRLATGLPPTLRRTLSGLWLDVTGLPARMADPDRRGEPWQTLHNVGGGDYRAAGEGVVRLLQAHAGLTAASRVLDIGCGTGRAAARLAEVLGPEGAYTGFDVSTRAVAGCRRRFARIRPAFDFVHLDLANGEYNAKGGRAETAARFPAADASVDVALATSVFSHMRIEAVAAYLREAARTLSADGRFLFTAYAITPGRTSADQLQPYCDSSRVLDARSPERLIAHQEAAIRAAVAQADLNVTHQAYGTWAEGATYGDRQDLYVVGRR